MFTRPCLLASWHIYALLQPHTVKNTQNATIFALFLKLYGNSNQRYWPHKYVNRNVWSVTYFISDSGADFYRHLFSTQTHLFIVGSWKESTTICQDILYFSEPSISEIRSVKTQKHTINSANSVKEHRDVLDRTKLLMKNSHFLFPLNFSCLCFDGLIHLLSSGVVLLNSCLSESLFSISIFQSKLDCKI